MAFIAAVKASAAGAALAASAAAAAGDAVDNISGLLVVRNTDTLAKTVTAASQVAARPGVAPANVSLTLAPGATGVIKTGAREFSDADGRVQLTYDAVVGVTVAHLAL